MKKHSSLRLRNLIIAASREEDIVQHLSHLTSYATTSYLENSL